MTRHLCLSVTLLDPLFHGKGDGDQPEWPPSPMRVFQALVAGARAGCRGLAWNGERRAAFEWLERQNPPLIIAPQAREWLSRCSYFVPNNDSDKVFERQERLTSKVFRPFRLLDGDAIHYIWPVDDSGISHAAVICKEARHIMALGWGIDQAVGDGRILSDAEVGALAGCRWLPSKVAQPGSRILRVPQEGSMKDLEQAYASFARRIVGETYCPPRKAMKFDRVHYSKNVLPLRFYAAFKLSDGVAFRPERANEIAAMLRSLACNRAKSDEHKFPGGSETYVAGHVADKNGSTPPRFSYLPLPSIGHRHADGMIRRLLIAEPYGGDGLHARWAERQLHRQILRDHNDNEVGMLFSLEQTERMVDRYVKESQSWVSVTPVILPGFDNGKHAKAEKLLLQSIAQAGIPVEIIADLVLSKAPFWTSSRYANHYHRPNYLKHLPAWHVRLSFRDSVGGPMSLGAGRHCGLGVFARMDDVQ